MSASSFTTSATAGIVLTPTSAASLGLKRIDNNYRYGAHKAVAQRENQAS
ncbi:hypothetical protein [Paraburkholderia oxyphila]|nr:hypothetical protein [Paraburkholderia oxyphila]